MSARCGGFWFLTSITTIAQNPPVVGKRRTRVAPHSTTRKSDLLWPSVRSAGCITATNARQREILDCFRGMARRSVRSCAVQRATPVRQPVLQLRSQVVQTGYSSRSPCLGFRRNDTCPCPIPYTEFSVGTITCPTSKAATNHLSSCHQKTTSTVDELRR